MKEFSKLPSLLSIKNISKLHLIKTSKSQVHCIKDYLKSQFCFHTTRFLNFCEDEASDC